MAGIETTQSFNTGDQVTAATLNGIITGAKLNSSAVDGTNITVTSNGVLGLGQVDTANLVSSAVTLAKLANIADDKVLGNTSGSSAAPSEISTATVSAAGFTPTSYGTEESVKLPNGLIIKFGRDSVSGTDHTVTFDTSGETAFSSVIAAFVIAERSGTLVTSSSLDNVTTTTVKGQFTTGTTHMNYLVIGK